MQTDDEKPSMRHIKKWRPIYYFFSFHENFTSKPRFRAKILFNSAQHKRSIWLTWYVIPDTTDRFHMTS